MRQVLEEKLSIILSEIGVDKYSDVLDCEVAEYDFTEAYMRSIGNPRKVEDALYSVESEMKQQLVNSRKYKEILRENKDLIALVGKESDFDIEDALRKVLGYHGAWRGEPSVKLESIGINDEKITGFLNAEILHDKFSPLLSVGIENFPNESGYFMLWELSLSDKRSERRIFPIFVNSNLVLRPIAGKRIMNVFLDSSSKLLVKATANLDEKTYSILEHMSMEYAYDEFVQMREKYFQQKQESHRKYVYALDLRAEAAEQIGIENIKRSRLLRIQKEKEILEQNYHKEIVVYPDFRLVFLAQLEG